MGMQNFLQGIFASSNTRKLRKHWARVARINALESEFAALSDDALRAKTDAFKTALAEGATLDSLLEPAFAVVREAAKRTLGQRPFDVQLIGGMVLHEGGISEMKTGEGKTLVATLPCYLNALTERGVHVVTVNDYLAKRDADWMGVVHEFLGLRVGCITHEMDDAERQTAYTADITYGTNNEFGFDYLRDNMKYTRREMVQRGHNFAIVDEVDSILIDEARTPLIISGPLEDESALYTDIDAIIPQLTEEDYELDEKVNQVNLTEAGNERVELLLREHGHLDADASIYDVHNVTLVHHVTNALRAHIVFKRDRDYMVKSGQVVIIDEFTGRMMEGRRFSDGLHQALEAKEGVAIQPENRTLASVTFQNYFRLFDKLAGMTGTAITEADEFMDIYGLDVVEVPTNTDIARVDDDDEIYRTAEEKFAAIIDMVADCRTRAQPVLVGTTSIEKSEHLSRLLKQKKIPHNVLNARYHEQEASIIAQAGVAGAVTIATNMAGRGTDIQLGGNLETRLNEASDASEQTRITADHAEAHKRVCDAGGLCVIGTERHESRRIDNQLRGRSGRQGDPGRSRFFLSLEDDLMRIFGGGRMDAMLQRFGIEEGEAIAHPWLNKALERAQKKVETRNFDLRKNILKYDDVMNDQRKVIFEQRLEFMDSTDVSANIREMRLQLIDELVAAHIPPRAYAEQWNIDGLAAQVEDYFGITPPLQIWAGEDGIADSEICERLYTASDQAAARRSAELGPDTMRDIEKAVLLQTLDAHWREHLLNLEHLRQIVGLRGFGQRDPLAEFKLEAFTLFSDLLQRLRGDVCRYVMRLQIEAIPSAHDIPTPQELAMPDATPPPALHDEPAPFVKPTPVQNQYAKVGRNAPCPCGSGKKFKQCCGAN